MEPRELIQHIEKNVSLPSGGGDRFAGYAVIGLPFRSGHVLALRRFPASSLGPGYTSVWHRDPGGHWTFYSTTAPEQSCSRYFGSEIEENVHAQIRIEWDGPRTFRVIADCSRRLSWEVTLTQTAASRLMNAAARLAPDSWWRKRFLLRVMSFSARFVLGTGKMNLAGRTPNGQEFIANPQRIWLVKSSRAVVDGVDAGPAGPLPEQARLNDFLIPERGIFAVARAFLETTGKAVTVSRTGRRRPSGLSPGEEAPA
jgi:hypothetical protein